MSAVVAFLRFHIIRFLERIFWPDGLYRWLLPIVCCRAAFKKCPAAEPLPAVLGQGMVIPGTTRSWRNHYLNSTLSFFSERLAEPMWLGRCSFSGLDQLREVQRQGQPAILAVCHIGPVFLLRRWLQAAGIRAVTLVNGQAETRSYLNRLKDRGALFPELPPVFYPNQLREVTQFLDADHVLIIAIDSPTGNQIQVFVNGQTQFRMATGALRLAARHGARVFPCTILDENHWRFRIEIGHPVPAEWLTGTPDLRAAGKHLLSEMLPCFQAHSEQCSKMLLECFQSAASK